MRLTAILRMVDFLETSTHRSTRLMEDVKAKITREIEATSDGQVQRKQTDSRSIPSASPVNYTGLLATIDFLSTGTRIGTEVMKKLKEDIAREIEATEDDDEDSEYPTTIYTPSHSDNSLDHESQHDTKHRISDLDNPTAEKLVNSPEHTSLSKADVAAIQDALAPLLKPLASKDDVAGLLKDICTQNDGITPFRNDARMDLVGKVREVRMLWKTLFTQIDALQNDVNAVEQQSNDLIDKATAQDYSSVGHYHEALQEPQELLTNRITALRRRLAELKEDQDLMMRKFSALPLDDTLHAAGTEDEIGAEIEALLNELAR